MKILHQQLFMLKECYLIVSNANKILQENKKKYSIRYKK